MYTLSIQATGNGSATYSGNTMRNNTQNFSVEEGTSATIIFSPDNDYQIKSVKVNDIDCTSSVTNNLYTISNITQNTTLAVAFEAIPPTMYTLSIQASGNGSATYGGTTVRNNTQNFSVEEGTSATITFSPDEGHKVKSVLVDGVDVTNDVSNHQYATNTISKDTWFEVSFAEEIKSFTYLNMNYSVLSDEDKTIVLDKGDYGKVLDVPATITYNGEEWTIVGIADGALDSHEELAAIFWHPSTAFTAMISNPNLLLYVKDASYAPTSVKNVIVNGTANEIILTDADSGNGFYCPQEFVARHITYTHTYTMTTGIEETRGWETIILPFDVQNVTHEVNGELATFSLWQSGDATKPFWLMQLDESGWSAAESIKANMPYIISMPNNPLYLETYLLNGAVTFSSDNAHIKPTEDLPTARYQDKIFVPTYSEVGMGEGAFALNVNNLYETNVSGMTEGSRFVLNSRKVHPFEAYMRTATKGTRAIAIEEAMGGTAEDDRQTPVNIYNLKGQMLRSVSDLEMEDAKYSLPAGVYIINRKKILVK